MRFNPDLVGDIGEVTSPPYDMMDRDMIGSLLDDHPQNIVRLVLPRLVSDPVYAESPYVRAARLLQRWRRHHVLVTDTEPALYVYEYGDATTTICGIVGALELRKRDTGVVLPHEDVIPEIVADRLAMMSTARANLEPILLVYDGNGSTSDILTSASEADPLVDVDAQDGTFHRIWAVGGDDDIQLVRQALAPHQALIADGHHRYAAYLQLRRRRRSVGEGQGPWDRGLAMLIDQSQYPLRLGAIHRSLSEFRLEDVSAPPGFELGPLEKTSVATPQAPVEAGRIVLSDGERERTLRVATAKGSLAIDAEQLHRRLLPSWGVSEDRVGYHHSVQQTLRSAHQDAGIAVLMHPTSVKEVMEVARAGKMLPRKSTSFGPKPRTGLVMRSFDDEP